MEDENKAGSDASNQTEEVALESTDGAEEESKAEESVEEVKAKLAKAEELAKNYKIRAEKAERKSKDAPKAEVSAKELSQKDLYAMIQAKVPQEDVDEVVDYAKLKGITVAEALKSSVVKTILSENEEKRRIASATNTGPARRSPQKLSDEAVLEKASKGELPEDAESLAEARMKARRNK